MSLLDDVSIVVTPNGYKAGELYAVIPTFALGSEEVSNGDLSNGTVGFTPFNSTIANVSNTLQITNTASYGSAGADVLTTIVGRRYEFSADVKSGTSTTALMRAGITPNGIDLLNVTAFSITSTFVKHTFYFVATSTTSYVSLWSGSATIGHTIFFDNVSVKEYTSADMDVTRATAATRVDENGLVNYAEIIGSEEITNGDFATDLSGWVTNATIWSSGRAYVDAVPTGSGYIVQTILDSNKTYLIEATLEVVQGAAKLQLGSGDGSTVTYSSGTHQISVIKGGSELGSDGKIYFARENSTAQFYVDNVSVKEVDRDNVPRIDYTGGGCPHILAEPQRTNDFTQSNDFANAYWSKNSTAIDTSIGTDGIQSNISTSPDGTINADRVNFLLQSDKDIGLARSLDSSVGITHSCSVWLKGEGTNIGKDVIIRVKRSYGGSYVAVDKTVTLTSIWQRVETEPLTLVTDNAGVRTILSSNDATNCLIYGFQSEVGSYPTSYIPTSGSTVTRNQDIFTRDGIGSLINSTEGVLFVEMAVLSDDSTLKSITLSDGTGGNRVIINYSNASNRLTADVRVGAVGQAFMQTYSYTITNFLKNALNIENDLYLG